MLVHKRCLFCGVRHSPKRSCVSSFMVQGIVSTNGEPNAEKFEVFTVKTTVSVKPWTHSFDPQRSLHPLGNLVHKIVLNDVPSYHPVILEQYPSYVVFSSRIYTTIAVACTAKLGFVLNGVFTLATAADISL